MTETQNLPENVLKDMKKKNIDIELTLKILGNFNEGRYDDVKPIRVSDLPEIDGKTIMNLTESFSLRIPADTARDRIESIDRSIDLTSIAETEGADLVFDRKALNRLGILLFPYVAYGVLNGGSATSYADRKKNEGFNSALFSLLEGEFQQLAELSTGRAKGLTPAFIQPDGTPGPSFLQLKMRALLIQSLQYRMLTGKALDTLSPFFQMTSIYNDGEVAEAYREYRNSPLLSDLIRETGIEITVAATGVQPLLAAFTHSSEGRPKRIFTRAYGEEDNTLPLPGGHGQNFSVLKDIYRDLHAQGKRFAYIGNVDNLGYTVNPVAVAMLALTGKQGGFDFAFRTPVDVKGGILVVDQEGNLNCADIGPAISREEIFRAEESGKRILFNCATGLFNLEYLAPNLDYVIENLPMRFSDQDKDAGRYSQAEQITWEIIGMMRDFLVFGIDKYERFLAAKLLMETLMTSGIKLDAPEYPSDEDPGKDFLSLARKMHGGLEEKLRGVYGMKREGDRWIPKTVAELKADFS